MKTIKRTGFTLIELMIVVAIIGILAAIGFVKYSNMILKTREANVKSSLGTLRSTISIYYSDNEGVNPAGPAGDNQSTLSDSLVPKYLKEVPSIYVYPYHPLTNTVDNVDSADFVAADPSDDGEWVYVSNPADRNWGMVAVECYHSDTKNVVWSSY